MTRGRGLRWWLVLAVLVAPLSAQELVWEQQEGALARWEQVRHSGNTVLVAGNGAVQKLDAGTGTVLWTHTGMSLSGAHDLTPYSGGVLVSGTYNDGSVTHFAVHALSPSGSSLWSYARPASNVYSGDDDTAYAVVECGGVVIALGKVETNLNDTLLVVGLDPSTGSVLWEFTDVSPATNAARDGVCLPGGDVIIAAVFQDTAYAYRLTPSGTLVWKQSLGHEVLVENKVLGLELDPSGNGVVVGTEWHGGLTYRMFATAINPSGTILWDYLHASDFRAEAFAIQDTLIYAVGNAGSDYTAPGMVVALNTNGSQRWSRTTYSGIRFHGAAADTFGNLFAVGEDPGTYDTTGFVIAFSPTGRKLYHDFLYGPVGEGAWDVTAVGSDPVIAGATYTTGRIGSVARFHLLPYLVLDSLTWDDGGDRLPNTEGDPATGNLFLRWHWHIEGGQGNLNAYLSCTICTELSLLDSTATLTGLAPGDTLTTSFGAVLQPSGDSFHLWIRAGLTDTFDMKDTVLHVVPQVGSTPVFTVYDNTDDHYVQHPSFSWVDAQALGSPVTFTSGQAVLPLPQPFTLQGIQYDSVRVGQKGWLILGTGISPYVGDTLPNGDPVPLFHVLHAPYHAYASGYTYADASRWVVEWVDAGYAFELILDYGNPADPSDDELLWQYQTVSAFPNVGDVGFQDATGQNGATLAFMDTWGGSVTYRPYVYPLGDQRAMRLVPLPGGPYQVVADSVRWLDGNNGAPGAGGDPSVTLRTYVHNAGATTGPVWGTVACVDVGNGLCSAVHFADSVDTLGVLDTGASGQLNFALSLDSTGTPGETLKLEIVVRSPFSQDTLVASWALLNDAPPSGGPVLADSMRWLDGSDNQPGATGDPSVTVRAFVHNAGSATGPVQGVLSCLDTGNGLCNAVHFTDSTDSLPTLADFATDSLQFALSLDSTGMPGETLKLRLFVISPVNTDTFVVSWALVNDLTPPPPGGPESLMVGMGYTGIEPGDSTDYWMPALTWQELDPDYGGTGTLLPLATGSGDDGRGWIALPMPFFYDGALFDTLWVSTNGWAVLGSDPGTSDYTPDSIPTADGKSVLAVLWKDLKFASYGTNGGIYTLYRAADSTLLVEWSRVGRYADATDTASFQLWLRFSDSSLVFLYKDTPSSAYLGSSVTIGIENRAETDGIQVLLDGTYHPHAYPITAGHGVYFTPSPTTSVKERAVPPAAFALSLEKGRVRLALPEGGQVRLLLHDVLGRKRWAWNRALGPGRHTINLPALPPGIYLLRYEDGHRESLQKFVVVR